MNAKWKTRFVAAGLAAAAFCSSSAWAGLITGDSGDSGIGAPHSSFSGTIQVNPLGPDSASLVVTLTNTSTDPDRNLIAFALNDPGPITSVTAGAGAFPTGFVLIPLMNDEVNASPFGRFDFGVGPCSTQSCFEGGNPQDENDNLIGLAVGETGIFTFTLAGTGVGSLTQTDFITALSAPHSDSHGNPCFIARFRPHGGAKVPAVCTPEEGGGGVGVGVGLAEPHPLAILAVGLLSIGAIRRRVAIRT